MGNIFYNQVGGDKFWLRVEEMSGERRVVSGGGLLGLNAKAQKR